MGIDKLTPHDPRVRYLTAPARGKTYGYLLAEPADAPIDTILLLHGFPDLSFGWRYQIPHLVSLGYRVVAPDAVGYASTDAPQELEAYTTASPADDCRDSRRPRHGRRDVLASRGPPPAARQGRLQRLHAGPRGGRHAHAARGPDCGRQVDALWLLKLAAAHGPRGRSAHPGPRQDSTASQRHVRRHHRPRRARHQSLHGVKFDILPHLGPTPLISASELDYYTEQYMRRAAPQMRGPLNYYRLQALNWADGAAQKDKAVRIRMPALFIAAAEEDGAVPPSLAEGMGKIVLDLTSELVQAGHWALWQAPAAINETLKGWLNSVAQKT
ncbi:hypothetical protein LMH87_004385 [Akanthomyces muscarius]|uniref:AB hydrolase-1 domain-containing protein n=1 Tax=Akanthomyces muscarius TaxID=2231603 RepID=A0A9W8Q6D2_AKAMU|nr:hypothetical protein LMH87_004385 [Akanthomyces muscarius]KAJ4145537.1 hypothetical protein LMH87_004385 [Akanthomyces muscarius]